MGQSMSMRAPCHYLRVDLRDPAEAEYWLLVLDVSRPLLEHALAVAGRDAHAVGAYLDQLRAGRACAGQIVE
jgi:hypothetical protein